MVAARRRLGCLPKLLLQGPRHAPRTCLQPRAAQALPTKALLRLVDALWARTALRRLVEQPAGDVRRTCGPGGGLSVDQWHYAGKSLFEAYAIWQMVMVVLLTPAMVAGVIAEERERKTMPSLLASGLTSGEIVLGKLCARLFHLGCFVALGMPILVLVERFGGVGLKGVLITLRGDGDHGVLPRGGFDPRVDAGPPAA